MSRGLGDVYKRQVLMEYISGAVQSSLPSQDEVEATPEAKN